MRRYRWIAALAGIAMMTALPVRAGPADPANKPFVATLSNNAPLLFGMSPQQTAQALQAPLAYLSGPPGHEVFLATVTNGHFFPRTDAIFLQFRKGRLTGWKVDRRIARGF